MLKKACFAAGAVLIYGTAAADWMKVFSAHDFPLSVLPGAANTVMFCSVAGANPKPSPPVNDLRLLNAWTEEGYQSEETPPWASDWSKRLKPLAMYLGRVSATPSGDYVYSPVPDGAAPFLQRTTQSDSVAVDVAVGFASWVLQPLRMIDGGNEGGYAPLAMFDNDASTVLNKIWTSSFVPRLPYDGIDTLVGRDAAATFEAFHALVFGDPVFVRPPPTQDSIRRSLLKKHTRTVAELQRFKDGTGEFRRWKVLEDVVHSLDRPEVEAGFEALRMKEEERLKSKLVDGVRSSLPSTAVIGLAANPSTGELPGVSKTVSSQTERCGVTALEANAVETIGRLAYVQARLLVTRELSSGPLSFTGLGLGNGAAGLDADAKELMRAFFPLAAASIARRASYEFFWTYTYRTIADKKSGKAIVIPMLSVSDTADTRKAKEEAAKLLNRTSGMVSLERKLVPK